MAWSFPGLPSQHWALREGDQAMSPQTLCAGGVRGPSVVPDVADGDMECWALPTGYRIALLLELGRDLPMCAVSESRGCWG